MTDKAEQDQPQPNRPWIAAAAMVAIASLLGLLSLAAFCYAYGLNFQDEGWSRASGETPPIKTNWLVGAVAGTICATFLFWIGLIRLTRHGAK
ncbi:MAG: hypothetical protein WBD20_13515 [Pirellulaceae bacterium]